MSHRAREMQVCTTITKSSTTRVHHGQYGVRKRIRFSFWHERMGWFLFRIYCNLVKLHKNNCKNNKWLYSARFPCSRALFRWIIAKDIGKSSGRDISRPNASMTLLKGVKSGRETYHQLFKKLCRYAIVNHYNLLNGLLFHCSGCHTILCLQTKNII